MRTIKDNKEELEKTVIQAEHEPIKPFLNLEKGQEKKSFPGNIDNRIKETFLMNNKIKDRLYAYLLMYSYTRTDNNSGEKYYVTSVEDLLKWMEMK